MRIQLSLLLLAATQIGATECGTVLRDSGFDLWCGEDLCTWKVVRGDAKRVDTWHEGDSGVELVGTDAAIAQLSPVNYVDGTCIRFDMVANVSEDAQATLRIDVYGDGSIEHTAPIPTSDWKSVSYKLRFAKPFTGIRFEIAKAGTGKAVFANIGAVIETGCEGLPEIGGGPAPLGAYCVADTDCKDTMCRLVPDSDSFLGFAKRCTACDPTSCPTGNVCGVAEPISPVLAVPLRCEPAAGSDLGEQCVIDAECASGICALGACSTCDSDAPCAGGEECTTAWFYGPLVCSPGGARRTSGQPCATNADCASGLCNGAVRDVCSTDGRPCGNDTNCPVLDNSLTPGTCETVGVTGGTCQ
jgi:hypothetical protein